MSNINKQALREAAEKAVSEGEGSWQAWREAGQKYPEVFTSSGHIVATVNGAFGVSRSNFIAAANPATVLALLDELEAAEKRIAELEARSVKLPSDLQWSYNDGASKGEVYAFNNGIDACRVALHNQGVNVFDKNALNEHAAGITVKGE